MLWNTIAINEKPDKSNLPESRFTLSEGFITEEDIKNVVESSLGPNIQVIDYHAKAFSEEKMGFLGMHLRLSVTIQRPDCKDREVYSYFLKTIPHNNEAQAFAIAECRAFYKETNFYRCIAPELLESAEDKMFIPRCYLVKDDVLIFEDLTVKNFCVKDKLLDGTSLTSALTTLANLHAASILAEQRLGKTFIELYPDLFHEGIFNKKGKFFEWFTTGVNALVAIAKSLKLDDQYIPKVCDRVFELISTSKKRKNVVCHGDVKSLNIMFDKSLPLPKCILVDFQLIRYAPPMMDVAQLIYINTTRELRQNLEADLLKHYHTVFSAILTKGNYKQKVPTYDDIIQEFEELRVIGLVSNALYSPINHIEGKKCAKMTKDSDDFSKLIFQDRDELILKMMQEDVKYKEILEEIVTEINERAVGLLQK